MSQDLATLERPASPPAAQIVRVPTKDGPKEVRGKLKRALDRMVWEGMPWNDAARVEGFNVAAMRKALTRPHVARYLKDQRHVFRQSASAQNISRAVEIRDQDENRTAAIQAIKYLDGIDERDGANAAGKSVVPGVVVQITNVVAASQMDDMPLIEVNPLNDQASGSDEDGNSQG